MPGAYSPEDQRSRYSPRAPRLGSGLAKIAFSGDPIIDAKTTRLRAISYLSTGIPPMWEILESLRIRGGRKTPERGSPFVVMMTGLHKFRTLSASHFR